MTAGDDSFSVIYRGVKTLTTLSLALVLFPMRREVILVKKTLYRTYMYLLKGYPDLKNGTLVAKVPNLPGYPWNLFQP